MSYQYKAHLSSTLTGYSHYQSIEIPSLSDARNGFWVDEKDQFTRNLDDGVMWIPPAQIQYIKKTENAQD